MDISSLLLPLTPRGGIKDSQKIWQDFTILDKLESERNGKRKRLGRLSFDCMNLKCKGGRVVCSKFHHLGQARDGTLGLVTVLRGTTSGVCIGCEDFDSGYLGNSA